MKIIFKIHPLYFVVAFICFLTGYFRLFITTTLIILFHELGHLLGIIICNWKIDKIILLPFGALITTKELINKPLKEELLITILGPIFQIFFYYFFHTSYLKPIHYSLLFFNLLPIIPLDGSKLFNNLLNRIFSFKKSHLISIYVSFISIFIIGYFIRNLIFYLILFFLIKENIKEFKNHKYIFNRFLYERYNYEIKYSKIKIINHITKMKKNKNHVLKIKNIYYTEKEYLKKKYLNP